jgi:hypothetical protein
MFAVTLASGTTDGGSCFAACGLAIDFFARAACSNLLRLTAAEARTSETLLRG